VSFGDRFHQYKERFMQKRKDARVIAARIHRADLDNLQSAVRELRRRTGEHWSLSRLLREGAALLAQAAREGGAR
jgi:hypothetical protein